MPKSADICRLLRGELDPIRLRQLGAAWDALPDRTKARLEGLIREHTHLPQN